MAEPAAKPHAANDAPPSDLLGKAQAIADRIAELKRDLAAARGLAQQAHVREALTRTELTVALTEALSGRAQLAAQLRELAAQHYLKAGGGALRSRRHNRLSRGVDRVLASLKTPGQALVIARAGVWRGAGRPLHDLRHMAAYARRRANAAVVPPVLFDQAWYLAVYADVVASRASPLVHYLTRGAFEGRSPHPLFDAGYYRRENAAELAASGVSPLEHYVRGGAAWARNPHPLFDIRHYVSQAPSLAPGEDPLSHYLRDGWRRGLSPHPLFDAAWYRRQLPRAATETPPLLHYVTHGWRQGLTPHPLFDPRWYLEQNPDLAATGVEPLSHFITVGALEGRSPSPWFDLPHYVAARGEHLGPQTNPLTDYLQGGAWTVGEARPGFPTAAYLASSPELVREGITPLEHWARQAAR